MKKVLFGLVLAAVALPLSAQQKPVYLDASKPIEERVWFRRVISGHWE